MGCSWGKETVNIDGKRYLVMQRLGEGGYSFVDLVEDTVDGKLYALKRVQTHSDEDELRALREVECHKMVQHPFVMPCYGWTMARPASDFKKPGELIMLLPYYKRGTLQDELNLRITKGIHLRESRVLEFFQKICEAVQVFHSVTPAPIAHRDLKPANILLAEDFCPVIMDLGSAGPARVEIKRSSEARILEDFAAENCSMYYRAPELFHVQSSTTIDERVDIWSLGCILYAICYFKSPFEAAHERGDSIALAVNSGVVRFPEDTIYSQGVHDLILSMLATTPDERPFISEVSERVKTLLALAEEHCGFEHNTLKD